MAGLLDLQQYAQRLRSMEGEFPEEMRETLQTLLNQLGSLPTNGLLPHEIAQFIQELPKLTEEDIEKLGHRDSVCPICFNTLLAALAEEEMALAMDSPAHASEDLGVTRLHNTCGHIFCRKDLSQWVRGGHSSCPMCRRPLVNPSTEPQNEDQTPRDGRTMLGNLSGLTNLFQLLGQMEGHVDGILSRSARGERTEEEEEQRSNRDTDLSGMYS